MATKTECPSAAWDRYYDSQESAEAEVIHEWFTNEIEKVRPRIGNKTSVHRDHFKPADGWPEDPAEIADEITNLVGSHGAMVEVIMLLAKVTARLDEHKPLGFQQSERLPADFQPAERHRESYRRIDPPE